MKKVVKPKRKVVLTTPVKIVRKRRSSSADEEKFIFGGMILLTLSALVLFIVSDGFRPSVEQNIPQTYASVQWETYRNNDFGFQFDYPAALSFPEDAVAWEGENGDMKMYPARTLVPVRFKQVQARDSSHLLSLYSNIIGIKFNIYERPGNFESLREYALELGEEAPVVKSTTFAGKEAFVIQGEFGAESDINYTRIVFEHRGSIYSIAYMYPGDGQPLTRAQEVSLKQISAILTSFSLF